MHLEKLWISAGRLYTQSRNSKFQFWTQNVYAGSDTAPDTFRNNKYTVLEATDTDQQHQSGC